MKEYIKKFNSLAAADGHVIDNPFVSTIVTQGGGFNLTCNEPDKKIEINDGQIEIVDNGIIIDTENWAYITFTDSILNTSVTAYRCYELDSLDEEFEDEYGTYTKNLRCFITADGIPYYLVEHDNSDGFSEDNTKAIIMKQGYFEIYNESRVIVANYFTAGRGIKMMMH